MSSAAFGFYDVVYLQKASKVSHSTLYKRRKLALCFQPPAKILVSFGKEPERCCRHEHHRVVWGVVTNL